MFEILLIVFMSKQDIADLDHQHNKMLRQRFIILYSAIGFAYTSTEIISYIILYMYIANHDNKTVQGILDPSVIKMRNRANAIRSQFHNKN